MLNDRSICKNRLLLSYSRHFKFNSSELKSLSSPINFSPCILHLSTHSNQKFGSHYKLLSLITTYIPNLHLINQLCFFSGLFFKVHSLPCRPLPLPWFWSLACLAGFIARANVPVLSFFLFNYYFIEVCFKNTNAK